MDAAAFCPLECPTRKTGPKEQHLARLQGILLAPDALIDKWPHLTIHYTLVGRHLKIVAFSVKNSGNLISVTSKISQKTCLQPNMAQAEDHINWSGIRRQEIKNKSVAASGCFLVTGNTGSLHSLKQVSQPHMVIQVWKTLSGGWRGICPVHYKDI